MVDSGLDGCRACGLCFFYNREEASTPVGIRAEQKLSSYGMGPCGMNTARINQFFIIAMPLVALAVPIGFSRFWVSAAEITNLSEEWI